VNLEEINLFVGPNGVGKSRILRDIHNQMRNGHKKTVILDSINYESAKDSDDFATHVAIKENKKIIDTYGVGCANTNLKNYNSFELLKNKTPSLNEGHGQNKKQMFEDLFSKTKVAYLDAYSRLEVAKSVAAANPNGGSPLSLLQSLTEGFEEIGEELHKIFNLAFERSIKLDRFSSGIITFKDRKNNELKEIPNKYRKIKNFPNSFPLLDDQGDGFKSFVCIVLSILLCKDKIILIDEPEAFLHPKQIRVLGNWIAEYSLSNGNQILIATHNSYFLNSILNNTEINVIRLNRDNDFTRFSQISPKIVTEISKDPLLSSLPILESVFYRGVILCEGDSDRVFYKSVMDKLIDCDEDILFINTHGKHVMKNIIPFVKESKVPFKLIADFDLLLSTDEFDELVKRLTTERNYQEIISARKMFSRIIIGKTEEELKQQTFQKLKRLLNKKSETSSMPLTKLKKSVENFSEKSKTDKIKKNGINGIENEHKSLVQHLIENSKKNGLFIVPYGDLESWFRKNIDKREWIEFALTNVNNNNISPQLNHFITDLYDSFRKSELPK
jgi:predicted ATP-dependent endonuclease of OLD family